MSVIILSVCGMVIGAFYDFLKCIRKNFSYNTFLSIACDFVFWIFALFMVLKTMYVRYALELRFHRLFGIFLGILMYFLMFSPLFLKFYDIFFEFFKKIFKILFTFIQFCVKILKNCIRFLFSPFVWIGKRIGKFILKIRFEILQQIKFIKRK